MATVVESTSKTQAPAKDMTGWATQPSDLKAVRDAYALFRRRQGGGK